KAGALGGRRYPLPVRDIDRVFHRLLLERDGDLLALLDRPRAGPGGPQLLDLRVARPAEPGLLAAGRIGDAEGRVRGFEAAARGEEDAPSALARRILLAAPCDHGTELHRVELHVHPRLAQRLREDR